MSLRRPLPHVLRSVIASGALLLACSAAAAAPIVYADLPAEKAAALPSVQQAFARRFTITPVSGRDKFVPAKITRQTVHPYLRNVGRVTLMAVADVDGRLRDPVVVESTNPRLNLVMQNSVKNWRCVPARLSGARVRSVVTKTVDVRRGTPVRIF